MAIHAARETLERLAGHRDPVHVHMDIPIFTIGVAVVTRLATRSQLPCLSARDSKLRRNRHSALFIAHSTQPIRSSRDRWSAPGSALHRPIFFNLIEEFHSS